MIQDTTKFGLSGAYRQCREQGARTILFYFKIKILLSAKQYAHKNCAPKTSVFNGNMIKF